MVDPCVGTTDKSNLDEEFEVASEVTFTHFACRLSEEPDTGQKVTFQLDETENEKTKEVVGSCVVQPGTVSSSVTTASRSSRTPSTS